MILTAAGSQNARNHGSLGDWKMIAVALAMLLIVNHAVSRNTMTEPYLGGRDFGLTRFQQRAIVPELTCFLPHLSLDIKYHRVPAHFRKNARQNEFLTTERQGRS